MNKLAIAFIILVILIFGVYYWMAHSSSASAAATAPVVAAAPAGVALGATAPAPVPVQFSLCQNDIATWNPTCPSGQNLTINNAQYGRFSTSTCADPTPGAPASVNSLCTGASVLPQLQALCNGKNSCTVGDPTAAFSDPCPNIYKQLQGSYQCS